jgi:hypothetical protein
MLRSLMGVTGIVAACAVLMFAGAARAQVVLFNTFGAADSFSTTSPLLVGRQTATTNVFAAKFTTTSGGTITAAQVALGPTAPAGQQVTLIARLFATSGATGLPSSAVETLVPQTVTMGAAQIVTFPSTLFLDVSPGTPITSWLVISIEEPVASGRTVLWNKSPTATGALALSANGAAFVSQGTGVAMPAFKLIGEVINGACCNHATGQCQVTAHSNCTIWTGFTYVAGNACTPQNCPPTCPGDFNDSGGVSVQDIFDYLSAFFAGCP